MNKKLYNNIFITILVFSDFLSGALAFSLSFDFEDTNFFLSGADYDLIYAFFFDTVLLVSYIFFC